MRSLLLLLAAVGLTACGSSGKIPEADASTLRVLATFENQIAPASTGNMAVDEPGQRLVILGQLQASRPCGGSGVAIHAYQADRTGRYHAAVPGVEQTARLQASFRTDSHGRFLLRTILPGDYGTTADNRHIHLTVEGAQPAAYDFYFRQHLSWGLRRWAEQSNQAIILDLARVPDGRLVAQGEVVVRGSVDRADCMSQLE